MIEQTNPFSALKDAMATLEWRGAHPLRNLPDEVDWRKQILSILTSRKYRGGDYYFEVSIHIDFDGFKMLLGLLPQMEPVRTKHSDDYDKLAIYLDHGGYMLEVMSLVLKEETK